LLFRYPTEEAVSKKRTGKRAEFWGEKRKGKQKNCLENLL